MATNRGFFYTLRKHWKKSTFAAIAAIYGIHFATEKHRANIVRRRLCAQAAEFGRQSTKATDKQRRVIVFVNPKAGNGTARRFLKQDVIPIFNLSGLDVVYIELDYVGQAKTLVNYLDKTTDTIVVAGGSGTVLEVVTGLLSKSSEEPKQYSIPIGVIPVGEENSLFEALLPDRCKNMPKARLAGEAALAIVKKESKLVNVMKIETKETGKCVYALSSIKWGILRDIASDYDRYWWSGPLKKRIAYIISTIKNWPPLLSADLASSSCTGNTSSESNHQHTLSYHTNGNSSNDYAVKSLSNVPVTVDSLEIDIDSHYDEKLRISIWPKSVDRKKFIAIGWNQLRKNDRRKMEDKGVETTIMTRELYFRPIGRDIWYSIDGEDYEAYPVNIRILPKCIQLYHPS